MGEKLEKMQESATKIIRRLKKILKWSHLKNSLFLFTKKEKQEGMVGTGGRTPLSRVPRGPSCRQGLPALGSLRHRCPRVSTTPAPCIQILCSLCETTEIYLRSLCQAERVRGKKVTVWSVAGSIHFQISLVLVFQPQPCFSAKWPERNHTPKG